MIIKHLSSLTNTLACLITISRIKKKAVHEINRNDQLKSIHKIFHISLRETFRIKIVFIFLVNKKFI